MNAPDTVLRSLGQALPDPRGSTFDPGGAFLGREPADPDIESAAQTSHRLFIRQCLVTTWIGVYEHEQLRPTGLLFDIDLDVDGRLAASSDRIADTVDYASVVDDLRVSLAQQRHRLLERLADAVAQRILARFRVWRVRVSVAKVGILEDVAQVGVEVVRYQSPGGSRAT